MKVPMVHVANSDTLLGYVIDIDEWKALVGDSRPFNRVGHAIHGHRPQFKQLKESLSLKAQVAYSVCWS
jgi:uncharacterized protein (DUF486 family)